MHTYVILHAACAFGVFIAFTIQIMQGYHGAAIGKGRQLAKTEIEKLKLSEMSTREAAIEAARMCVVSHVARLPVWH